MQLKNKNKNKGILSCIWCKIQHNFKLMFRQERKIERRYLLSSQDINKLHLFLESVDQLFNLFFFQMKLLQTLITNSNQFVFQFLKMSIQLLRFFPNNHGPVFIKYNNRLNTGNPKSKLSHTIKLRRITRPARVHFIKHFWRVKRQFRRLKRMA